MNPTGYTIDFVIPQGPTGPTGPANGLSAYGGKYNDTPQTLNLVIGSASQIPLTNSMPNLNTTYTPVNSITVAQAGTYEINYFSNVSAAIGTTVTQAVRVNGTNIPSTEISRVLAVGVGSTYTGSTIVTLAAGDVIDMAVSALLAVGFSGEHFTWNSWHMSGIERKLIARGCAYYAPIRYSELPRYYRESDTPDDVAMFQVSPMDAHGYFNFGPNASHMMAV